MLAPWEKSHDKPRQNIKNQKHHFTDKSPYKQSYGFSVVLHGCESWTIKRAEGQRINDFKLWSWRRFLRVPWTARRSTQSILKEINLEYSLERLMLKCQYFGHLKSWLIGKDPDARKDWRQEKRAAEGEMVGWHHQPTDMSLRKLWEIVKNKEGWRAAIHGLQSVGHDLVSE